MTSTDAAALLARFESMPLDTLMAEALSIKRQHHRNIVSYSRKVFIPVTHLCRDVCAYCTFAKRPSELASLYLSPDQVLDIARQGQKAGCKEALLTLGDKPELRYAAARERLRELGFETTIAYVIHLCRLILDETGLLPHVNAGILTEEELAAVREVSVSQGIMLETVAERLSEKGGPHYGSPDKHPAVRLEMTETAGRLAIPFTSGLLIGIGETRAERIETLLAIKELHDRYGHIQEVIVQNFRSKPNTRMAGCTEPDMQDLLWTIAAARLIFGPMMNIQAPPNLSRADFPHLLDAGINDWGGISPVTPDHVNPEAPWPAIGQLARASAERGALLLERLAVYPDYCLEPARWLAPALQGKVLAAVDASGYVRENEWAVGVGNARLPALETPGLQPAASREIDAILASHANGAPLERRHIERLFQARGEDVKIVRTAADELRRKRKGDVVAYVVNRNINYTNVCSYACSFCAFSKGRGARSLRGVPYDLDVGEIQRRVSEGWSRGATEVCMQGGIHPDYTGETYLAILQAVKAAEPAMHVHAFSPLEVQHGAETSGLGLRSYLERMKEAGLGSLPGTAAEILVDRVREVLCKDKLNTAQWLEVMRTAHTVGLRSTATIMFGHVDREADWADHIIAIRDLQAETGGFTEFVPLPFVHMEAPIYHRGAARRGPTYREAILMHAVARLAFDGLIDNIQTSWVKMGTEGAAECLQSGANDLGGTLMNESISRAAGTQHGQELPPAAMDALIRKIGRVPRHRTTLYGDVPDLRVAMSYQADDLEPVQLTPAGKLARVRAA